MIKYKNNFIGIIVLCFFAFGCADPVSAYVAKQKSDNVRKEFDSVDATLIKPSDSINANLTNNNYKLLDGDSLYKAYSDSIEKH